MITTIRNQFKQSTYRYVVFFLVSVIALSMASSLFIKIDRREASWALRVNGTEIPYQALSREVAKQAQYLAQIKAQYGQYADLLFQSMGWSFDPKSRALDILVKETLVTQYGQKLGIKLHPSYITSVLNNAQFVKQNLSNIIPPFVFDQSGLLDMNIVQSYLRQSGMTAQQFEESIERALIQQQTLDFVAATTYIPSFDVKQHFMSKYASKQFSYLTFSFDHFLAEEKKTEVSDEDIQSFYDAQNKQYRRYWVPEKRSASVWKFEPHKYALALSDEEIKEYYEDNKVKQYVQDPLKVEVQQIMLDRAAAETNQTVEALERALTDGSLDYEKYWKTLKPFARGDHKGELEKSAFLLQKEGELSSVFETKKGKSIVRLVKRIPRTYKPLASVKKEIETVLVNKAFKKSFVKDIKQVVVQNDDQAMETFIKEKGGSKEVAADVFKDDSLLSQQVFSLNKGQYGFFVDNGVGVAVLLTGITERHLPDVASIKEIVKGDLHESRAHNTLQEKIAQARQEAQTQSLEAVRSLFGVPMNTTDMIDPTDNKKLQELSKKGLPVHEMLAAEKEGSVFVYGGERDSFLVKLETVEAFDEDKFLSLENDLRNHLGPIRTRLLLNSVVASLHRNATIETNESILITSEDYSE